MRRWRNAAYAGTRATRLAISDPPERVRRRDLARHPPGLADVGLIDCRTMEFEVRYAQGQPERLRGLVEDLLRLDVA